MADTLTGLEVTASPNFPDHDDATNYDFPSLQRCVDFVVANGVSASKPATINLPPGIYSVDNTVVAASNICINGSGKDRTFLVTAAETFIIDGASTSNLIISNLTVIHNGATTSGRAISVSNASGCRIESVRVITTGQATGILKGDTSLVAGDTNDLYLRDVDIDGTGFDNLKLSNTNLHAYACRLVHKSGVDGNDNIAVSVGTFIFEGCEIQEVAALTLSGGSRPFRVTASNGQNTIHFIGSKVLLDISAGDINSSTLTLAAIDIANGVQAGHDYDLYIEGSTIEYKSSAITSAAFFGGVWLGRPTTDSTKGRCRIIGSQIRDIGGSGSTVRKDVGIAATDAGGVKIMQSFTQTGSRLSWAHVTTGAPAIVESRYGVTENTQNLQRGVATFATAATVAVTLPVAFSDTAIIDYNVALEPSINETFWVTAKTNTGFTMNSSNATSTATVRYLVTR